MKLPIKKPGKKKDGIIKCHQVGIKNGSGDLLIKH
jgi:hypothetical protein